MLHDESEILHGGCRSAAAPSRVSCWQASRHRKKGATDNLNPSQYQYKKKYFDCWCCVPSQHQLVTPDFESFSATNEKRRETVVEAANLESPPSYQGRPPAAREAPSALRCLFPSDVSLPLPSIHRRARTAPNREPLASRTEKAACRAVSLP